MRPLNRLWPSLEAIAGQLAIPAFWEAYCGADVGLVRPYLRVTDMEGDNYPCSKRHEGFRSRQIVDYGNGEFAALCRDRYEPCERVELTQKDVLLQRLDVASFSRVLAGPLGIRWQEPVPRGDGTWGIGVSERRDSRSQPVFLVLLPETERFVAVVLRLLVSMRSAFVLAAPTKRHRTLEIQEMIATHGVSFMALEDHLLLDDDGRLIPADIPETGRQIRATPSQDRRRLVRQFTARNRCKVKDIQEAAAVHAGDYYRWLKGGIPDHYSTCVAIEKVLATDLPQRDGSKFP